jgi:hypothetical protein
MEDGSKSVRISATCNRPIAGGAYFLISAAAAVKNQLGGEQQSGNYPDEVGK